MKPKTWIAVALATALLAAVWGYAAWHSSGRPVEAALVRRGPIRAMIDERGMTRLPQTYVVTMPYAGRIEPIALGEGDAVKKDDPLGPVARVVREDLQIGVDQARAAVERLDAAIRENLASQLEALVRQQTEKINLSMQQTVSAAENRLTASAEKVKVSERHLQRLELLKKQRTVTDDELDQAGLDAVQAKVDHLQDQLVFAAVKAMYAATELLPKMVDQYIADKGLKDAVLHKERAEAAARLEKATLDQKRGTLVSPVDGVVLKRFVSDERFLAAGEPLLEIGRLEDLEVEADVLSLDVVEARRGDRVEVYGPAVGKKVRGQDRDYALGTVANIYPAGFTKVSSLGVEQQRVKVVVRVDAEDLAWLRRERGLGVGYRVRVRIVTTEKPDALVVPRPALFRAPGGTWELYVVRNGRVEKQAVELGILNDRHAEILAGLEEGDLVVRAPESDLAAGTPVAAEVVEEPK